MRLIFLMNNGALPSAYKVLTAAMQGMKERFGSSKFIEEWPSEIQDVRVKAPEHIQNLYTRFKETGTLNNMVDHCNKKYGVHYSKEPAPTIDETVDIIAKMKHEDLWQIVKKTRGASASSEHMIDILAFDETIHKVAMWNNADRVFGVANFMKVDSPPTNEKSYYPEEYRPVVGQYVADGIKRFPDSISLVNIGNASHVAKFLSPIKNDVLMVYPHLGPVIKPEDGELRQTKTLNGIRVHSFDATDLSSEELVTRIESLARSRDDRPNTMVSPVEGREMANIISSYPELKSLPTILIAGNKEDKAVKNLMKNIEPFFTKMGYAVNPENIEWYALPTIGVVDPDEHKKSSRDSDFRYVAQCAQIRRGEDKVHKFAIGRNLGDDVTSLDISSERQFDAACQSLQYCALENIDLAKSKGYKKVISAQSTAACLNDITGEEFLACQHHNGNTVDAVFNESNKDKREEVAKFLEEKGIRYTLKTLSDDESYLVVPDINNGDVAKKIFEVRKSIMSENPSRFREGQQKEQKDTAEIYK